MCIRDSHMICEKSKIMLGSRSYQDYMQEQMAYAVFAVRRGMSLRAVVTKYSAMREASQERVYLISGT